MTEGKKIKEKAVVIGSSAGGPKALKEIIPYIPYNLPAGILVVQHMPPKFTSYLAERLDKISRIRVREARHGDCVKTAQVLVAPGDFHMEIGNDFRVSLNRNPPVKGVRPAVDVTLASAAGTYGEDLVCVILTGMGSDGTDGAAAVKVNNGYCIVQDERTSLVYGMAKSVVDAGLADEVQPLGKIADAIVEAVYG